MTKRWSGSDNPSMKELCGTCGKRWGRHRGVECPHDAFSLPDREMGEQADKSHKTICPHCGEDLYVACYWPEPANVQPLPASAGDSVRDLTDELVRMVIAGFENQQQGKIPANGHIHGCKSCYEQALALRSASPVAPLLSDSQILGMVNEVFEKAVLEPSERDYGAAANFCTDTNIAIEVVKRRLAGASPVAEDKP